MNQSCEDVAILGGGLAGLTLALQLKRQDKDLRITVLERNTHPVPEAAHKVGESTVEIGAHYFAEILGQREHLENQQLRKFGLRFFFNSGQVDDLAAAVEQGPSAPLTVPTYQIDRGIFENHLGQEVHRHAVTFLDGARCRRVELDAARTHRVEYSRDGREYSLSARWVIDAQSRASLLKRQLNLAEDNGHHVNAVWFRIAQRIDLAEWSDVPAWQARCTVLPRWLSTNHLMGKGYWVWLIPLSSGSTSVGIVVDPDVHPLEPLRNFNGAMDWLKLHQPRCAQAIEPYRDKLQDFRFLKGFSHGCSQVFSADRWALTGEAGVFLDPYYSPGSDFIAISNTYICDLIRRERAGRPIDQLTRQYQHLYFTFYESMLQLYRHQYPLFGHARVMALKTIWDYAYYWAVLAQLYLRDRLTDFALLARHAEGLQRTQRLNVALQSLFRAWARRRPESPPRGVFVDQNAIPALISLNEKLTVPAEGEALDKRLRDNFSLLEDLTAELIALAPPECAAELCVDIRRPQRGDRILAGLPEAFLGQVA